MQIIHKNVQLSQKNVQGFDAVELQTMKNKERKEINGILAKRLKKTAQAYFTVELFKDQTSHRKLDFTYRKWHCDIFGHFYTVTV